MCYRTQFELLTPIHRPAASEKCTAGQLNPRGGRGVPDSATQHICTSASRRRVMWIDTVETEDRVEMDQSARLILRHLGNRNPSRRCPISLPYPEEGGNVSVDKFHSPCP